jgi:hypothetical protein
LDLLNKACPYYPNQCYIVGQGPPSYAHYPLYAEQVVAWCSDLKDRNPDNGSIVEVPSIAVFAGLRKAKDAVKESRDNRAVANAAADIGAPIPS